MTLEHPESRSVGALPHIGRTELSSPLPVEESTVKLFQLKQVGWVKTRHLTSDRVSPIELAAMLGRDPAYNPLKSLD